MLINSSKPFSGALERHLTVMLSLLLKAVKHMEIEHLYILLSSIAQKLGLSQ